MRLRAIAEQARGAIARMKNRLFGKGPAHLRLGKLGEDLAAASLSSRGYTIIERNARIYRREVDIIAKDGDVLVFVEVKARTGRTHGGPEGAVNNRRRARLKKAALLYAASKKLNGASIRFDVVTVDFSENDNGEVEIIRNAF